MEGCRVTPWGIKLVYKKCPNRVEFPRFPTCCGRPFGTSLLLRAKLLTANVAVPKGDGLLGLSSREQTRTPSASAVPGGRRGFSVCLNPMSGARA